MSAYQAIYSMGHLLIQLILVAGIIFILPVLSFFVLPATKYSGLAMPLAVVSAILIPEEESIKIQNPKREVCFEFRLGPCSGNPASPVGAYLEFRA